MSDSEEGLDCFVVSPIGADNSPIRERADFIFERYIQPACKPINYRAFRSDHLDSPTISDEMKKWLEESPIVVVYLGSPKYGWNPNVMFEFGYRKRSRKPLVILKDETVDGQPYSLPFDITDYRCIDIPEEGRHEPRGKYRIRVRTITNYLKLPNPDPDPEWMHSYPGATIEIGGGAAKITEAMGDLETLFNVTPVLRKNLETDILPHLYRSMPQKQVDPFKREQQQLIGAIAAGAYKDVHATVPMLFSDHPMMCGRAFLPVIVSYSHTDVLRLNIIYVEVTGALKKHNDGYFCCHLVGQPLAQPRVDGGSPAGTLPSAISVGAPGLREATGGG